VGRGQSQRQRQQEADFLWQRTSHFCT
jgi:hypothetical protein